MSVVGHHRLVKLLESTDVDERLVVTPLLQPTQIREASIDIRLGQDFVVTRRGNLPYIDAASMDLTASRRFLGRHYVNAKSPFHLHPNELVLASTLEYFRLPISLSAWVTSRSRWGRVGLVIATATAIQPGYCGTITLELVNLGEVPLVLYPGLKVAQIIFNEAREATKYSGTFSSQVDPALASISDDQDLKFWTQR